MLKQRNLRRKRLPGKTLKQKNLMKRFPGRKLRQRRKRLPGRKLRQRNSRRKRLPRKPLRQRDVMKRLPGRKLRHRDLRRKRLPGRKLKPRDLRMKRMPRNLIGQGKGHQTARWSLQDCRLSWLVRNFEKQQKQKQLCLHQVLKSAGVRAKKKV